MSTTSPFRALVFSNNGTDGLDTDRMAGANENHWTQWFNVDVPWKGDGDYETVKNIEKHFGKICETDYRITDAECIGTGPDAKVFDRKGPDSSLFAEYCTTKGLICKNADQIPHGKMCDNYSIRFHCTYYDNDGSFFPQFDVRIYIILAVVPILIFLARILWAYVFRRRRQRRRAARRARRLNRTSSSGDDDDDNSSVASGLANPPPSYHEIFGNYGARASVFTICGDNVPVCSKCESTPCSVALSVSKRRIVDGDGTTETANEQTQTSQDTGGRDEQNPEDGAIEHSTTVDMEESDHVDRDITVSVNAMSQETPSQNNGVSVSTTPADNAGGTFTEIDLGEASPPSDTAQGASPAHESVVQVEIEQTTPNAASENETNQAPTSTNSRDRRVHFSPTPLSDSPYYFQPKSDISQPCACPCHRTIPFRNQGVQAYENPAFTNDAEDGGADRRELVPGMHIPVPGLRRVWSNLSTASVVTLSELPSYADALELMKKKKEKELESQQTTNENPNPNK